MSNKKKKVLFGYLFSSLWIIGFLLFGLYPIVRSIRFAFSMDTIDVNGNVIPGEKFNAVTGEYIFRGFGAGQIVKLFKDNPAHLETIGSFVVDILAVVPIVLIFSLVLAILLNSKIKGRSIFRSIFFLPVVLLSGTMLSYFSSYNLLTVPSITNGALFEVISNYFPDFLSDTIILIFSKIVLILWLSGVQILIFLAGLSKIDSSIYEAAKVDGASSWECFFKITLPHVIPLMYINIIYTAVIYSNLGSYNPMIHLIESVSTNTVKYGRGYQSMLSWLLFLIDIVTIGLYSLIVKLASKRYE